MFGARSEYDLPAGGFGACACRYTISARRAAKPAAVAIGFGVMWLPRLRALRFPMAAAARAATALWTVYALCAIGPSERRPVPPPQRRVTRPLIAAALLESEVTGAELGRPQPHEALWAIGPKLGVLVQAVLGLLSPISRAAFASMDPRSTSDRGAPLLNAPPRGRFARPIVPLVAVKRKCNDAAP